MTRLTSEERLFLYNAYVDHGKSPTVALRKFSSRWPGKRKPTRRAVSDIYAKVRQTGSIGNNNNNRARQATVRTPEMIEQVAKFVARSTKTRKPSSRARLALKFGVSSTSLQRILRKDLKLKPYKERTVQALTSDHITARREFCKNMIESGFDTSKIIFTDEAHFHVIGAVNSQNTRYYGETNPNIQRETKKYPNRVTVLCGVSDEGLVGPFIFNENVDAPFYNHLLRCKLLPRCKSMGIAHNHWLQQDGATAHTTKRNLAAIKRAFDCRVISRHASKHAPIGIEWPANSPDLSPCDFYLWGHIKSIVYARVYRDVASLKAAIRAACRSVRVETLKLVFESLSKRVQACHDCGGLHFEHILK